MSEQAEKAVAAASLFWLASKVIGGAIVGIEVVRKRYALSAVMAAFTVFYFPWINPGIGDCGTMTVHSSQTALAVMVLFLTVELLSTTRSWWGRVAAGIAIIASIIILTLPLAVGGFPPFGYLAGYYTGHGLSSDAWRSLGAAALGGVGLVGGIWLLRSGLKNTPKDKPR